MTKENVHPLSAATVIPPPAVNGTAATPISLDDRLRELEASLITWALGVCRGNKSKAARLLQVKRSTLGDRINRCGLGRRTEATPVTAKPAADRPSELVSR